MTERESIKKALLALFDDFGVFKPGRWRKHLDLRQRLLDLEMPDFELDVPLRLYSILNDIYFRPLCCICNKPSSFNSLKRGFLTTCGHNSCVMKQKHVTAKIKKTMVERHGVEHALQSNKIKDQLKKNNLEKYGVEHVFQSDIFKQRSKDSCRKLYGTEYASSSEEVKLKRAKTNVERYGSVSPLQNSNIANKTAETLKSKYGVSTWAQSSYHIQKTQKTNIERYGSPNAMQSVESRTKLSKTLFEKRNLKQGFTPLFKNWEGNLVEHNWRHDSCNTEFFYTGAIPKCPKCKFSAEEFKLINFLTEIGSNFITCDRKQINPYELDFYFPAEKIAIEINGIFWHHENSHCLPLLKKTQLAKEKGIQLLHFWDFEINENFEAVCSIILSKLNLNKRVFARNTTVQQISATDAKLFLSEYHLQGFNHAKCHIGIFFENNLIGVASYGKSRFSKNADSELIRFACLPGITIVGGLSKTISKAHSILKFNRLISYADIRISNGGAYSVIGFKKIAVTKPNYFYFKSGKKIQRYSAMKHKLNQILEKFDPTLTEKQNMENNGWLKCNDCGNHKFVLSF